MRCRWRRTQTFATTLYSQFNSAATTMALSSLSNSTTYYWRAGAKNAGGVSGWSTAWSFTTVIAAPTSSPALSLPSDGATNQPVNLTLSWGTVVNAATYAVQVATDPTFATTLYSQWNNSATSDGAEQPVEQHDVLLACRGEERGRGEWMVDRQQLYYGDSGADLISDAGAAV